MTQAAPRAHPFMPNSVPQVKQKLLDALGITSVEELFAQIPADHRASSFQDFPPALSSEVELERHLRDVLSKNRSCEENLSFLGGGLWRHYVPAVCDEIVRRSEFLTPVWGTPSSDHGRNQAWFEFTSQLGELLEMDLVGLPVYSWGSAAGHAIRMAARMTGRRTVLIPRLIDPERRGVIATMCAPPEMPSHIRVVEIDVDESGQLDLKALQAALGHDVAAVYFENPSYVGVIESRAAEIAALARRSGAETIVGVDPVSLGVLAPPAAYGADIAVGSIQPLGVHMNCGGGVGGFIASRDEPRYAREYPTLLLSAAETVRPGEVGFSMALFHQSSYGSREHGKDWTGNSTYLWAIAAAVYMSLLGPEGFRELGELIVQRAHFAARLLERIPGVRLPWPSGFFKEFVVNFDGTGRSVSQINEALRERGIFGGLDLSGAFPSLGQSALYCVTELHSEADLRRLAAALNEVCAK